MFFDVGKLMLLPVLMELKSNRSDITAEIVRDVMRNLSAEISVSLLKNWGFTEKFINVVKIRSEIVTPEDGHVEQGVLILSSIAAESGHLSDKNEALSSSVEYWLDQLGLTMEQLLEAWEEAEQFVRDVKKSFV
jgi:HD-like signal output (HDOD) protein